MPRYLLACLLVIVAAVARAGEAPADDKEIAALLGRAEIRDVRWTKYQGSDFRIYYCIGESPRAGVAGLYLTESPILSQPGERDIVVDGMFGRFPVKWVRRVIKDGSRQAEAVVQYGPKKWAQVLIEARDEVSMMRFISEFGQLAMFAPPTREKSFVGPGFIDTGLRQSSSAASAE